MSLALLLREGTAASHTAAENSSFMRCFIKGALDHKTYAAYLESFYFVYSALEEELELRKDHPVLAKIWFPELYRTAQIEQDLTHFVAANQAPATPTGTQAARAYAQRIREAANSAPHLLVAHSYVRYLGDLSGGQLLKRVAARALGLGIDGSSGLGFYEFPEIASPKRFKDNYRSALDAMPLSEAEQQSIVDEANLAFGLNAQIFDELEHTLIASIGQKRFEEAQVTDALAVDN